MQSFGTTLFFRSVPPLPVHWSGIWYQYIDMSNSVVTTKWASFDYWASCMRHLKDVSPKQPVMPKNSSFNSCRNIVSIVDWSQRGIVWLSRISYKKLREKSERPNTLFRRLSNSAFCNKWSHSIARGLKGFANIKMAEFHWRMRLTVSSRGEYAADRVGAARELNQLLTNLVVAVRFMNRVSVILDSAICHYWVLDSEIRSVRTIDETFILG